MEVIKVKELTSILKGIEAKKIFADDNIQILQIKLLPGEEISEHKNDVDALFLITKGKGIVKIEKEEAYVECGDFIKIEKNLNRSWKNYGDMPLTIIVTKLMK